MRFKVYRVGETRVRSGFLWFTRTIGNERRWLENARWKEYLSSAPHTFCPGEKPIWKGLEWLSP
jgi:hypothetical protein